MKKRNDKSKQSFLANERILRLFELAEEYVRDDCEMSRQCVMRARLIAMKYRIRIPRPFSRKYCRKCDSFLLPGYNARVRVNTGKVTVTCEKCGNARRYPYSRR